MSSPNNDDPGDKFDKFIRNFDKTLQTDTSTLKTIGIKSPTSFVTTSDNEEGNDTVHRPQSPINQTSFNSNSNSRITSPLLSTPTKPNRNSISLDNQPLKTDEEGDYSFNDSSRQRVVSTDDNGMRRISLLSKRVDSSPMQTPTNNSTGGLKRSSTMSSVRLGSKRGLNLNLSINKQRPSPSTNKLKSPETPSNTYNTNQSYEMHSSSGKFDRSRRRTNSSLSSHSSVVQDLKNNDFNDTLRELALKEMKIIELKDQMKLMQQKIDKEENELNALKAKIGNNFKELSPVQNPISPSIPSNTPGATTITSDNHLQHRSPTRNTPVSKKLETDNSSKRQSVWSKPINFLNQFDQILQNEIERLNREAFPPQQVRQHPAEILKEQEDENDNDNDKESKSDDVLNTVSNSLWSFVSDVKHGLLGDDYNSSETGNQPNSLPPQQQQTETNHNPQGSPGMINDKNYDNNEQEEMISIGKKQS